MIDIRLAREHPEEFRRALARKGAAAAFDELLTVDGLWREVTTEVDELRRRTRPKGKPTEAERAALALVSEELRQAEAKLEELDRRRSDLLAGLPEPARRLGSRRRQPTRTRWSCAGSGRCPSSLSRHGTTSS